MEMKEIKKEYNNVATIYGDEIAKEIRKKIGSGGEYELPSVIGDDYVSVGDPADPMLPITVYINGDKLMLEVEDYRENGISPDTMQVELKYPEVDIVVLETVNALLDRELD